MSRKTLFQADAFRNVLGFTFRHWAKQPLRAAFIGLLVLAATLAEAFSPIFAGRLVDAVASGSGQDDAFWIPAVTAFITMTALYLGSVILRQFVFFNIISFTLKMMNDVIANAFVRVQRFSTD